MTHILRSLGLILALTTAGLGLGAFASTSGAPAAAQSGGFTPLPPGWELCILQGLSAPTTAANVADLDEWQAAEGGSTNNTAAFNPYNTYRMTDVTGAELPGSTSANGFPAFATWAAGCAATVATLYQPNMWVITAALRAGTVAPPAAFLAVVDQSAWCAPSPDGTPCYVNAMESAPGSLALAVPATSALTVYGNVNSDLQSYQQSIAVVGNDQSGVAGRNLELAASDSKVELAQEHFAAASQALKGFAVSEYVSTGLFSGAPLEGSPGSQEVTQGTPQSADGVVAEQYIHLTAARLVAKSADAAAAVAAAQQLRAEAASALAQAALVLASDEAAENHTLSQLISDLATLEHAGACASVTVTPPAAAGGSSGSTTTTTTSAPDSTTTTVSLPPTTTTSTTVPSATSTTTTTVPSTTTTTDPLSPPTSTTSSTTVPSTTTTTTTTVPSTTTTTTAPSAAASSSPDATTPGEAAGVSALQGCLATFAPPSSA
jgi:hypothetical protein